MKQKANPFPDVLIVIGTAVLAAGLWQISPPLSLSSVGGFLMIAGLAMARGRDK